MIKTRLAPVLASVLGTLGACGAASASAQADAATTGVDAASQGAQTGAESAPDCKLSDVVGITRLAGTRVLSAGPTAWALFDTTTGAQIVRGTIAPGSSPDRIPLALVGTLALVPSATPEQLELRASASGELVAHLTPGGSIGSAGLAPDASYAWAASTTGLTVWSARGAQIYASVGTYQQAGIYATPTQLRVVHGATEPNRRPNEAPIVYRPELIDLTTGKATLYPNYVGRFRRWFDDGERFITDEPPGWDYYHFFSYDSRPVQSELQPRATGTLAVEGGYGDYVWARVTPLGDASSKSRLDVFQLSVTGDERAPSKQVATLPILGDEWVASGHGHVGLVDTQNQTIQLAHAADFAAGFRKFTVPGSPVRGSFAVDDAGRWVVALNRGRLVAGDASDRLQPLSCRAVQSCRDAPPWRPNSCVGLGLL